MQIFRKTIVILIKTLAIALLSAVMVMTVTGVSPVYDFVKPAPFSGPDIFNPYRNIDTSFCWKRANFHTHTRVEGLLNECDYPADEVYRRFERFGYDIVTFSNHNELTEHPFDPSLQVNVYEHGYNLFKYHKLVFGCDKVNRFDHLVPLFAFQKQFQIELLEKDSDFIQMNHPLRTIGMSRRQMEALSGYEIMELDSGKSTENEYWDWALSAGRYSFGLANDDLHYPDISRCIAVRCNFLCCPSAEYEDIRETLLDGCYYSMRIPDYGKGDWAVKEDKNRRLPYVRDIGLRDSTIFISVSQIADSIKVTGQNHKTLHMQADASKAEYSMRTEDSYARFTVYFPDGEVIYSNPFARFDSDSAESPLNQCEPEINISKTILFNLMLLAILILAAAAMSRIIRL